MGHECLEGAVPAPPVPNYALQLLVDVAYVPLRTCGRMLPQKDLSDAYFTG